MLRSLLVILSFVSVPSMAAYQGSPECQADFNASEFAILEGKYMGELSHPTSQATGIRVIITGVKQALVDDATDPLACVPYLEMQYGTLPVARIFSLRASSDEYVIQSDRVTNRDRAMPWTGKLKLIANGISVELVDHNQQMRRSDLVRVE